MNHEFDVLFRSIDLMGVVVNGLIGGTIARQRKFDVVGFAILAIISALGGGILRDMMLQGGKPVALTDHFYLLCALLGALLAWFMRLEGRLWRIILPFADGIVLGTWATTGTTKALSAGLEWLPALLMGLTTAIGGGMIRDVAVGKVPTVFGGNTLYATPAVIASGGVLVAHWAGLSPTWLMVIGAGLGLSLTTLAHFLDWRLPAHGEQEPWLPRRGRKTG